MAEAVVSFVLEKLGDLVIEEVGSLFGIHEQFESIRRELTRIQCFLKDADVKQKRDERVRNWVRDIRDIAYDVEDIIDTFILKLTSQTQRFGFVGCIQKHKFLFSQLAARRELVQEMQKIKARIAEISTGRVTYGIENIGGDKNSHVCEKLRERRRSSPNIGDHDFVGFAEDIRILVERLLDQGMPRRRVISIVGMGGLGKTTLAKKVYNCNDVKRHFELCAWVYVSQDYRVRELLNEIGRRVLRVDKSILAAMVKEDLEGKLCKVLSRKRYLIVVDDIWKIEAWEELKHVFPDVVNGSRLMFTTRIREVAMHADPSSPLHELRILSKSDSLELFMRKVFPLEDSPVPCPPELEALGLQLVMKCGGLPLAIVIIGGLLSRKQKTASVWLRVLRSIKWQLNHDSQQLSEILALSYDDLPYHLKPCFLYFGLFPEDSEIPVSKLMMLWMAEGFVQERELESLEDVAQDFLEELIDRSMIQVAELRYDGKIRTCRIHDLLRDLALSEAKECKFLQIIDDDDISSYASLSMARRIIFYTGFVKYTEYHNSTCIRSVLLMATCSDSIKRNQLFNFTKCHKLLRVLDMNGVKISILPKEIGTLIHLRYLGLRNTELKRFSFAISKLRNLQSLDMRATKISRIPNDIWQMQNLRNLYVQENTAITGHQPAKILALNLRILSTVSIYGTNWVPTFLSKFPNLRKLGINGFFVSQTEALSSTIVKLCSLESLQLRGTDSFPEQTLKLLLNQANICKLYLCGTIEKLPDPQQIQPNLIKLSLEATMLMEDPLVTLEKLPNLRMLRLLSDAFVGTEMMCSSRGFPKLHCLQLTHLDNLRRWRIEAGGMPSLLRLIISDCEELEMVPEGLQYVSSIREMIVEGMPDAFEVRIQQDTGHDWYKVQHIPSIIIRF